MRDKQVILDNLFYQAQKLDPQHYELAAVAMIETEVQIDIRDELYAIKNTLIYIGLNLEKQHSKPRKPA